MPAMPSAVYGRAGLVPGFPGALLAAIFLAWPPGAGAFGPSGHRVAAHVASRYLCAETREALRPLLAGRTLADAGIWPDTIRRDPDWQRSKPWHYLNVPDGGSIAREAARSPDNVLAALERFERELADPRLGAEQRGIALRFVVHLAADLHQPLHIGRAEDRGGNRVAVRVGERLTNLHAVWDGEVLRTKGVAPRDWARALRWPAAAELARWQRSAPRDWARESLALRSQVYALGAGREPVALTPDYRAGARQLLDRRLLEAGVRLAGRLDRLVGPGTPCATAVAAGRPNL